jgi:hypothetical protein
VAVRRRIRTKWMAESNLVIVQPVWIVGFGQEVKDKIVF